MRMLSRLARTGLAALALTLPGAAMADSADGKSADVSGSWTFTAAVDPTCSFTGTALLNQTSDPTLYNCELTATQACTVGEEEVLRFTVRQSCQARRIGGGQLSIRSSIEEFLEGEPTPYYLPDNFVLSIVSANRMTGALVSSASYAAEFLRSEDGIS